MLFAIYSFIVVYSLKEFWYFMKLSKKFVCVVVAFSLIFGSFSAAAIDVTSYGACVMDFESGEVLYSKNAQTQRAPASMTKIMTLYMLFEKLASGEIEKTTPVYISPCVSQKSHERGASNIPLAAGDSYSVEELINAMVVPSACAACTAIAEKLYGSEAAFIEKMNEKALEMGLSAHFADTSGLSDYNLISAQSVAVLVRNFILNYPDILNYTKKSGVYIRGKYYKTTNFLLDNTSEYFYSYADGFKTGTTNIAGKCLAATAQRGNTRIIAVTMHSSTAKTRCTDAIKLLESGFSDMDMYTSNIFSTDIRTYINNAEIPCYYYLGRKKALVIIAENLRNYGFSTNYKSDENTLYLTYTGGSSSVLPPVLKTPGAVMYPIYKNTDLKVAVVKNNVPVFLNTVYSLNGQCCISVDELGALYGYEWQDVSRSAQIKIK